MCATSYFEQKENLPYLLKSIPKARKDYLFLSRLLSLPPSLSLILISPRLQLLAVLAERTEFRGQELIPICSYCYQNCWAGPHIVNRQHRLCQSEHSNQLQMRNPLLPSHVKLKLFHSVRCNLWSCTLVRSLWGEFFPLCSFFLCPFPSYYFSFFVCFRCLAYLFSFSLRLISMTCALQQKYKVKFSELTFLLLL